MKKVSDEKNKFKSEVMVRKSLMMKYKEVFIILKMRFKFPLKKMYWKEEKKGKSFWLHADGLKLFLTMNPMEKPKKNQKT